MYVRSVESQEGLFIVQAGTVTFETDDGDVEAGDVVRFAPGEVQRGVNRGGERVVAFAVGVSRDSGVYALR